MQGEHFDVVIIGAGMAGLAAAIRLAHFGKNVGVFERHNVVGGLNSFYSFDGRKFDVGLHAMTNYVAPGVKGTPLGKLLRQLRIDRTELGLCEQIRSRIAFPEISLSFTNDFRHLEEEVASKFPQEIDAFRRLVSHIRQYNEVALDAEPASARKIVGSFLKDPMLVDMLFCPLMFYGSARENDMDFYQFAIMFKSIFFEGFARPVEGVRRVIRVLLDKCRKTGVTRKMKCGVRRLLVEGKRVGGLELDNGSIITADLVLSSIGDLETRRLWQEEEVSDEHPEAGRLSFVETISVLDVQPAEIGWDETIVFFNDSSRFHYEVPQQLVDPRSGVICFPNNFHYDGDALPEGLFRVTCLANYQEWAHLPEEEYRERKAQWFEQVTASALRFLPPFSTQKLRAHIVERDMFTPRTIKKYTGHLNGAVYGAPAKVKDGRTPLENLFLCGTDQGFLGIVGAMLSGISMANLHGLSPQMAQGDKQ
jgi:phytoene dehydrogenase-like protein